MPSGRSRRACGHRVVNWLETKVPPPVVALLSASAMWALARVTPRLAVAQGALDVAGVAVAVLGFGVEIAGIWAFWAARTTPNPLQPRHASTLVTDGVYRFTRNPMYVGDVIILLAWAIHLGSVVAIIGVVGFVAYIDRFQVRPEERALLELFGSVYDGFRARTRRWI